MKKNKLKSQPLPFLHHIDMLFSCCCPSDFKVLHGVIERMSSITLSWLHEAHVGKCGFTEKNTSI